MSNEIKKWAYDESIITNLGDKRLTNRLAKLTARFSDSPESPINQACLNWAETKAAYRFFNNDNIPYDNIISGHIQMTKERCKEYSTILAVQDTSYFNYSAHHKTTGLCPLTKREGINKRELVAMGLVMHSTLAVSTDGLPLGILNQKIYSREPLSKEKLSIKHKSHNNSLPIEEKESIRWVESLEKTQQTFINETQRIVTVCDRESDIYAFFKLAFLLKTAVLVRARYDRTVNKTSVYSEISGEKLWSLLKKKKSQGILKVLVPKQKNTHPRLAECQIRFSGFSLYPPKNYIASNKDNRKLNIKLFAIYVKEINYNKIKDPIEWMLLTNIPVFTLEDALEKIQWYCYRWRIEMFHKVLKSGLKVEDCRLQTAKRLIRYLSVMSIVAWRLFWLTFISRVIPKASCTVLLKNNEWKILFAKLYPDKKIPKRPPGLKTCIVWIAQLGGFLARKKDGDPGITHCWRGLKNFVYLIQGAELGQLVGNR